jgi:hypothetical protein
MSMFPDNNAAWFPVVFEEYIGSWMKDPEVLISSINF